jgi:hypothetical protein
MTALDAIWSNANRHFPGFVPPGGNDPWSAQHLTRS